ncbi:aspartic peptidase domain-containing protein [Xylariales sp. PMI_506]|nr:aspartic peptidase domain-containing protein [Xylariales sp. PMI_506]
MHWKGATSLPATLLAGAAASNVSTVYFPLNLYYGGNHKVSTGMFMPYSNTTVEVVFDQGSDSFWVFGPNSTMNWGCTSLFCEGPCNASVTSYYDYPDSGNATSPEPFIFEDAYGGFTKIVEGNLELNDTMIFTSVAGQQSTIPNVRVSVANFMIQRLGDDGDCIFDGEYDVAIMGIAPYQQGAEWNTTGPSVRQDLLDNGVIDAPVVSMWFDEAPANYNDTFTGGAVFGGVDLSKFTGPLIKIPRLAPDESGIAVGFVVSPPAVSVNGVAMDQTDLDATACLLDSGTRSDTLPVSIAGTDAFFNATGSGWSPEGFLSYFGACDTVPSDLTVDLTFAGAADASETIEIKIPLRNYVRQDPGYEEGYCWLNFDTDGCLLGVPFATAAYFAADDERFELALAQGGVSASGSGPDYDNIVARIP